MAARTGAARRDGSPPAAPRPAPPRLHLSSVDHVGRLVLEILMNVLQDGSLDGWPIRPLVDFLPARLERVRRRDRRL